MTKRSFALSGTTGISDEIKRYFNKLFEDLYPLMSARQGHTVTAREAFTGQAEIKTTVPIITGHIIQVYRAGSIVTGDAKVFVNGGNLYVENGESIYQLMPGDIVSWMAY